MQVADAMHKLGLALLADFSRHYVETNCKYITNPQTKRHVYDLTTWALTITDPELLAEHHRTVRQLLTWFNYAKTLASPLGYNVHIEGELVWFTELENAQ
jgi:hypothetical protein